MTYDPDKHNGLVIEPENDGFSHETPKRAFTDWVEHGNYAVGRGFRPATQHLAPYLAALDRKEGWELVQLLPSPDGRPSAAIFRKTGPRVLTVDLDGCMTQEQAERLRDSYRQHYSRPARMWGEGEEPLVDPERTFWREEISQADMDALTARMKLIPFRPDARAFLREESVETLWQFVETASVASYKRALLRFPPSLEELAAPVEMTEPMAGIAHAFSSITREDIDRYDAERPDDPINPRHYGGTACAEIGERLTANCYQVLKYCWRLGEKDDPVQELGKAIWYAERELAMGLPRSRGTGHLPGLKQKEVLDRTENAPWRREIALLLWDMCYGFGTGPHWASTAAELILRLRAKREEMTPG